MALQQVERHLQAEEAEAAQRALVIGEEALNQGQPLLALGSPADQACRAELVAAQRRTVARLKARLLLMPHLDDLRACYAQAQILLRRSADSQRGAPAEPLAPGDLPEVKAAAERVLRAERCREAGRRLQATSSAAPRQDAAVANRPAPRAGAEVLIELGPQQRVRIAEVMERLEEAQRVAGAELLAARAERDKIRARWLRLIHGDRLRVFQEHPDALPSYEGKARGPLPASIIPRWQYQSEDGRVETYLFRGSKLLRRSTGDARRS